MAGPEQRKMEKEARRQAALNQLKGIYRARENRKTGSSSPETSANTNKDNTSTAAGFRIPPPVIFTTGHILETTSNGRILIHNASSNPTSLKRKAEDNCHGSESEQEDQPKQGHKTKKAKPTSGYVPGEGPYRGTSNKNSNSQSSVSAGALGNKSTNGSLKTSEKLLKQDTKNLNRNAPKPKVPYGKGTRRPTQSRPTQGPPKVAVPEVMDGVVSGPLGLSKKKAPKVAEREAMDGVVTGPLQQTRKYAPKAKELDTMKDVKHGPLQAPKRKNEHDIENETVKKARMGPSTTPPDRELKVNANTVPKARTTSFFASNQKPGYTAAIPTNVKIVQEVVKKPIPTPPKTLGKNKESPKKKKVEAETPRKKRSREGDMETGTSKKTKFSASKPTGWKAPSVEEEPEEPPKGLKNHFKACFANAGLQGLLGVPELAEFYENFANGTLEEIKDVVSGDIVLMRKGEPRERAT